MKNSPFCIICLLTLLLSGSLNGQTDKDTLTIRMIGRGRGHSVALRWAPLNLKTWEAGIQKGYQLERVTLSMNGKPLDQTAREQSRILLSRRIVPLPEPEWAPLADTNEIAVVAAGSLYSSTFKINTGAGGPDGDLEDANTTGENRFSFSLFAADQFMDIAIAMGLGWVDHAVVPEGKYCYIVTLCEPEKDWVAEPGSAAVKPSDIPKLPVPDGLTGLFGDRHVKLKWDPAKTAVAYTSWQVERSWDGGKSFEPANRHPLIYMSPDAKDPFIYFPDTLRENKTMVVYRVRGKTPFGEWGPPSNPISGEGRPAPIPFQPYITGLREDEKHSLWVEWAVPEAAKGQIREYNVYRASSGTGPYFRLNPDPLDPATGYFVDSSPEHLNYYQVRLTDLNGHEISGLPKLSLLKDETPPDPPEPVGGKLLPDGVIELVWHPARAADCSGYRVYAGRTENGDYLQITDAALADTVYTTITGPGTVSEKLFFRIKAIDYRGNYSGLSTPIEIMLPDQTPPSPPVFKSVRSGKDGVLLTWANSGSKDLIRQELQRKLPKADEWETIFRMEKTDTFTHFFDPKTEPGVSFLYRLAAIDDAGLETWSRPVAGLRINTGITGEISDFKARGDQDEKCVLLLWKYNKMAEVKDFILYRSEKGLPVGAYQVLKPDSPQLEISGHLVRFKDPFPEKYKQYRYQVIARLRDGGYSKLSPEIGITD